MAKTQRSAYPTLPLSGTFYDALARVGERFGLDLSNRERLAQAVAALSHTYTRERGDLAQGDLGKAAPLARLGFFLPRDLVKLFGPLSELSRAGRLPTRKQLRVLDLGAGLGASSLGIARFLRHAQLGVERLEVTAIERDSLSTKLLAALCESVGSLPDEFVPITLEARSADLHTLKSRAEYDLIVLGFVLNELYLEQPAAERIPARAALLRKLMGQLAPDGALLVLEPALRESTRELMQVRDVLATAEPEGAPLIHVLAPCVRRGPCPMLRSERDWCHETLDFALPPTLVPVARAAGLRYEGLSYAALVLGHRARQAEPSETLLRIVSERLVSKGKLEYFGCGEVGYQRLTRLDRERSPHNAGFDQLRRGDLVELTGARVGRDTPIVKL